jgi:TolA-binding protein
MATNSYGTARRAFDELLASYPNDDYAPLALRYVGDSYVSEGNLSAADSVYQRVEERYPKTDEAPTAMYKRATKVLWPSRKSEARALLDRVVKDYPNATVRTLARDFLRDNR